MAVNLELIERKISLILQDLENEDAARFAKLAGLRNRLSHEYNGIDETIVFQAVKALVAELPTYIEGVKKFISD